jgi:hypothetical protein
MTREMLVSSMVGVFLICSAALDVACAEPLIELLRKNALFGRWAVDCSKPASPDHAHVLIRQAGEQVYYETVTNGEAAEPSVIEGAEEKPGGVLTLKLSNRSRRLEMMVMVVNDTWRTWRSERTDGRAFIADGRFTDNQQETAWLRRCK